LQAGFKITKNDGSKFKEGEKIYPFLYTHKSYYSIGRPVFTTTNFLGRGFYSQVEKDNKTYVLNVHSIKVIGSGVYKLGTSFVFESKDKVVSNESCVAVLSTNIVALTPVTLQLFLSPINYISIILFFLSYVILLIFVCCCKWEKDFKGKFN
jgi:hypothetical protein